MFLRFTREILERRAKVKKPLVVFGRPVQWATQSAEQKCRFHFLPILGLSPILRDGAPAHDSVGAMLDEGALRGAVEFFRAQRPEFFLFAPMYTRDGTKLQVSGVVRFLEELKTASPGTRFIYWNGNQQGKLDFNLEAFRPFVDAVLTNTRDPREHKVFYDAGIEKVDTLYQFGFDPAEHGRPQDPTHDCQFAGSQTFSGRPAKYPNSEWRYRFLCQAAERFDLVLYGKGQWPFPKKSHVVGQRFYDTFTEARVVLGANHWDYVRYYTRRTIYALASGRPYVMRYVPGMECDFENGRNVVWFKDASEGLEAVRALLDDPIRAALIGAEGRRLAVERFSWQALQLQLEKLVEGGL